MQVIEQQNNMQYTTWKKSQFVHNLDFDFIWHRRVFHKEMPDFGQSRSIALRRHPSSKRSVKVNQSKRFWRCRSSRFGKGFGQIMWISVETSALYQRRKSHLTVISQKSSFVCFPLSLDGFMISRSVGNVKCVMRASAGWVMVMHVCVAVRVCMLELLLSSHGSTPLIHIQHFIGSLMGYSQKKWLWFWTRFLLIYNCHCIHESWS